MVMLLFLVLGSGVLENALPVSLSVLPAAAVSLTVIVTVALTPLARLPTLQLRVPVAPRTGAVQVPAPVVKLTKVVPAGVASETTVFIATSGPLLVTLSVYLRFVPCGTGLGLSATVVARSAIGT